MREEGFDHGDGLREGVGEVHVASDLDTFEIAVIDLLLEVQRATHQLDRLLQRGASLGAEDGRREVDETRSPKALDDHELRQDPTERRASDSAAAKTSNGELATD